MNKYLSNLCHWSLRIVLAMAVGMLGALAVQAQGGAEAATKKPQTNAAPTAAPVSAPPALALPVLSEYKGVAIGTSVDTARERLGHLREKGVHQDFFVFSDNETAQVFYDDHGLVRAISVDFTGDLSKAPKPEAVVGMAVTPRADGSLYHKVAYPAVGYWITYSRTPGNNPIVSVTMQRM